MPGSACKIAFTVLLLLNHAFSFNILAIVSMPLGSHYMAFRTLFHELAIRGHNVTVINNFPDKNPPPNLKFVNLQRENMGSSQTLELYETIDASYMHLFNIYRHITFTPGGNKVDCETLLTSKDANTHLAQGRAYDVIFVEQFMGDCGLAYALALYDAPIIGISSHVLLPFSYPRFGIPFDVAADAFYFSNSGPNPSLFQKVETALVNLFFTTIGQWYFHRCIYEVFDRKMPNNTLDIEKDAKTRMKMMFSYQHFSVTGARPLSPQLLEIAGIHVGVPKPVPEVSLQLCTL
ncbi:Glucosyl/glucuronosyl transferase [Operophtera brumata]|uniref:Glucosyl/glucuronosyl transferase n=1 Tax=Operophtera brumata TaxID=104452 RepID=A0A0L7LKG1_OPEBR|nr:Glucosyl/glucuronosyl transferase [Operophtera brumata]